MQVASGSGRPARKGVGSLFDGGEIGSTGRGKGTSRPMQTLDANDNAPFAMALAA